MSAAAKFSVKGQSLALTRGRRKRWDSRRSSSSQSSTASSITKTVCFRAICESHQSYWFAVNISFEAEEELESRTKGRDSDEEDMMARFCGRRHHHFDGVTYGKFPTLEHGIQPYSTAKCHTGHPGHLWALILYCVGGALHKLKSKKKKSDYSRLVRVFDFNLPHNGWNKKLSVMISGREVPGLAVLDGKLYVFGGTGWCNKKSPWAEVYNPSIDKWEALPQLPPNIMDAIEDKPSFVVALHNLKKIVLDEYLYDVNTSSWEILKEDCCDCYGRAVNQQPVAVQDTIYWWSDRHGSDGYESVGGCPYIYAYDFSEMKLFQGHLKGLEHDTVISDIQSNLLHMGGECFCLLWCYGLTKTQYHCTQLQVSKQAQGVLNARVLSCQSFLTPGVASLFQAQMLG